MAVAGGAARPARGGAAGGVGPGLVAAASARRVVRRPRGAAARAPPLPHAGAAPRLLGGFGSLAALVACVGGIVLGGRVQETQVIDRDEATRDIVLCLDASGSSAPWNGEVADEYRDIVEGLDGDRIGLTDLEQRRDQQVPAHRRLRVRARPARPGRGGVRGLRRVAIGASSTTTRPAPSSRTDTTSPPWSRDGLVSCVQRFDRLDEDRGRALVLATDGEQRGRGVFNLAEAADYAADAGVVVHVIANPGEPDRNGDIDGLQAAADKTGGTFVRAGHRRLRGRRWSRRSTSSRRTEDRPAAAGPDARRGRAPARSSPGSGVGLLVLVWAVQGLIAPRRTEVDAMSPATSSVLLLARRVGDRRRAGADLVAAGVRHPRVSDASRPTSRSWSSSTAPGRWRRSTTRAARGSTACSRT